MVSDKTKYAYLVSMLDDRKAAQVMDLIEVPPTSAAYETLKKRLIDTFALTEREKAAKILDCSVLGDCSPSQVLNNLLSMYPRGRILDFYFEKCSYGNYQQMFNHILRKLNIEAVAHQI